MDRNIVTRERERRVRERKAEEIQDEKVVREDGSQEKLRVVKIYASHKNNAPCSKLHSITVITS